MLKNWQKILIVIPIILLGAIVFAHFANATTLEVGLNYAGATGLGTTDIRITIANIIRAFLGLLGIVAIVIILYGAVIYMTASGVPEKIEKAKKILIAGVIGLVIILSAFGIASYVISRILEATGAGGGGGGGCVGPQCGGCTTPPCWPPPGFCQDPDPTNSGPYICSLSPTSGPKGTLVTIKGGKFLTYDAATSKVYFNKTLATNEVEATVALCNGNPAWGENLIVVEVPNLTDLTTYYVNVVNSASGESQSKRATLGTNDNFTLETGEPGPGIACINPDSGIENSDVTVSGKRFGTTAGTLWFSTNKSATLSNWADEQIAAKVPVGSVSGDVYVKDAASRQSNNIYYRVTCSDNSNCSSTCCQNGSCVPADFCLPGPGQSCDADTSAAGCQKGNCRSDLYCDDNCTCQVRGVGSPCDGDIQAAGCQANSDLCGQGLYCSTTGNCTCQYLPRIDKIDPTDGAPGNYVTIFGRGFGDTAGKVHFYNNVLGIVPTGCGAADLWQDNQIIIEIPTNAANGKISVDTADGLNATSPTDFTINDTVRPSLCGVNPSSGKFGDSITLNGKNFGSTKASALIGGAEFNNKSAWDWLATGMQVSGLVVPNLSPATLPVQIKVGNNFSNSLNFSLSGAVGLPKIDYIDPVQGPTNQYVTIFGSNFGDQTGQVNFISSDGTITPAGVDFSQQCLQAGYWHNSNIVVKAPTNPSANYKIKVLRSSDGATSNESDYNLCDRNSTTCPLSPGICAIKPNQGPAGTTNIQIFGDNFGAQSGQANVKFWNNKNVIDSPLNWTNSAIGKAPGNKGAQVAGGITLPIGAITGPAQVVDSNGIVSNKVNFNVQDCRGAASNFCVSPLTCCQTSGICESQSECLGAAAATCSYSWAFTTGKLPAGPPQVIEDITCDTNTQSPTPWKNSTGNCINAGIGARFNQPMKFATGTAAEKTAILQNGFILQDCTNICPTPGVCTSGTCVGGSNDGKSCGNYDETKCAGPISGGSFTTASSTTESGFTYFPASLTAGHWYRVKLLSQYLKSVEGANLDGNSDGVPGGDYSWFFQVDPNGVDCIPSSVIVTPAIPNPITLTTLNETQDYQGNALAENCNILNPNNYPWKWSLIPITHDFGTVANLNPINRSSTTATSQDQGSDYVKAEIYPGESNNKVDADNELDVDLGKPEIDHIYPESGIVRAEATTNITIYGRNFGNVQKNCVGGSSNGNSCQIATDCPDPGVCTAVNSRGDIGIFFESKRCGGVNSGNLCTTNANCSGGKVCAIVRIEAPLADCKNNWSDTMIMIKAPLAAFPNNNDAQQIKVVSATKGDSNAKTFTRDDSKIYPFLCSLDPDNGLKGAPIIASGENFGDSNKNTIDNKVYSIGSNMVFMPVDSTTIPILNVSPTDITSWANKLINFLEPISDADTNEAQVTVQIALGAETYIDTNGNGQRDTGEVFLDANNNGTYDSGTIFNSNDLPFYFTPVITSVTPDNGPNKQWITITGYNFGTKPGKVCFGSTCDFFFPPAPCQNNWTNKQIIAVVPDNLSTGSYDLSIITNKGSDTSHYIAGLTSNTVGFTINTNPLGPGICDIIPAPASWGSNVTIEGTRFGDPPTDKSKPDNSDVIFSKNITPQTYKSWSDRSISQYLPYFTVSGPVYVSKKVQTGQACVGFSIGSFCPSGQYSPVYQTLLSNPFSINISPLVNPNPLPGPKCTTDADCQGNSSSCKSKCVNGICEPYISGFTPVEGPIGTWVTLDGCHFGCDKGEVYFTGDAKTGPAYKVDEKAFYQFTGNASDSSGNGYNGTLKNGALIQDNTLVLDGVGAYVNTPLTTPLGTSDYTISVWAKIPNQIQAGMIISKRENTSPWEQWYIGVMGVWNGGAEKNIFTTEIGPSGVRYVNTSGGQYADNNWHHIVAVRAVNSLKLYVDGTLIGENTGSRNNLARTDPWRIGDGNEVNGSPTYLFKGSIDEVRIYNRALSQDEVKKIFNYGYADYNNGLGYNLKALEPNNANCTFWNCSANGLNDQIIAEVPNKNTTTTTDDAQTGPIEVATSYGLIDDTSDLTPNIFTVNSNALPPKICGLYPTEGARGSIVKVYGDNLSTADSINFKPKTASDYLNEPYQDTNPAQYKWVTGDKYIDINNNGQYDSSASSTPVLKSDHSSPIDKAYFETSVNAGMSGSDCPDNYSNPTNGVDPNKTICFAVPPGAAGEGQGDLTALNSVSAVSTSAGESNKLDFLVNFPSGSTAEPLHIEQTVPLNTQTAFCRNGLIAIYFDDLIDTSDTSTSTWKDNFSLECAQSLSSKGSPINQGLAFIKNIFVKLTGLDNSVLAAGNCPLTSGSYTLNYINVKGVDNKEKTVVYIIPNNLLDAGSNFEVKIKGGPNGVKSSITGAQLDLSNSPIQTASQNDCKCSGFTTAAACAADSNCLWSNGSCANTEGADSCANVCTRDTTDNPLYGCPADQQCQGDQCSINAYDFKFQTAGDISLDPNLESNGICAINNIVVYVASTPDIGHLAPRDKYNDLFTCAGDNCQSQFDYDQGGLAGNQHKYRAEAKFSGGTTLAATYTWLRNDNLDPQRALSFAPIDDPGNNDLNTNSDKNKFTNISGEVYVTDAPIKQATSKLVIQAQAEGSGFVAQHDFNVYLLLCQNPWPSLNQLTFPEAQINAYNFGTWYCRDAPPGFNEDLPAAKILSSEVCQSDCQPGECDGRTDKCGKTCGDPNICGSQLCTAPDATKPYIMFCGCSLNSDCQSILGKDFICKNRSCICVPDCTAQQCGVSNCSGIYCLNHKVDQTGVGACPNGKTCTNGACITVCTPKTCAASQCGTIPDGCGGTIDCGNNCISPQTCGGGGTDNVCGCKKESDADLCASLEKSCGSVTANDNCGESRTVNCGSCTSPQTCSNGTCVTTCVHETNSAFCARLGDNCGSITANDNCGTSRTVNCGSCTLPETCGGGGTDNVCGCTPTETCANYSGQCGTSLSDGCANTLDCSNNCSSGQTCNAGQCCTPNWTCTAWFPANCAYSSQARTCTDSNNCGTDAGKPAENQTCLSTLNTISSFAFASPAVTGVITGTAIALTVPYGTVVTGLVPTIVISAGASVSPTSGVAHSFSSPATYIVTAADGSTQTYTVTVTIAPSSAKAITVFNFTTPAVTGTITEATHTITMNNVPYLTNVTNLTPTINVSTGATVSPASGIAHSFSSPATYIVTAADGSTQSYTVTVNCATGSTLSGGSCATTFSVKITGDNCEQVYVNGTFIGQDGYFNSLGSCLNQVPVADWTTVKTYSALPFTSGQNVIALKASDWGVARGLLAVFYANQTPIFMTNYGTSSSWKCTNLTLTTADPYNASDPTKDWYNASFDDSSWTTPPVQGTEGSTLYTGINNLTAAGASWIWSGSSGGNKILCRYKYTL